MSLAWPGNISFSGTVSAPLFVSNQQVIAPFAAGTASTLTVQSLSSNFGSLLSAYTATLSVGTILNFSAGGSIGTNLTLTGMLTSNSISSTYASFTSSSISTLTSSQLISGPALFNGSVSLASTAPLIGVATANPGDMLVTTAYTNPMDRYGIGQYTNAGSALTRVFTSGYYGSNATLALSIAGSGSGPTGTFLDVLNLRGNAGVGTLSSLGFVGINNSTPSYSLDVTGAVRLNNSIFASISNSMMLLNQTQAGTVSTNFSLYQGSAGDTSLNSASGSPLQFKVGNVEYARLSSAGLFGINNSSPSYNLDVVGTARVTGSFTAAGNTFGSVSNKSYLYNAGIISNYAGTVTDVGSGNVGIIFTSPATLDLVNGNNTSMLRVVGNTVGINNSSPSYTLDVAGTARITGSLSVISSSIPAMYQYTSGNNTRLQIDAANSWQSGIAFQSAGAETAVFYRPASSTDQRMYVSLGGDVMTWTNTSPSRVGINNTSPSYTLDVSGTARVTGTSVLAQSAWIAVTFQNSFANLNALPQTQCAYMKDSMGFVHLQGVITNSSTQSYTVAFTLPAGFRTSTYRNFLGATSGSAVNNNINLPPGGNVNLVIAANQWVDLGVVSYLADS